MSSDSPRLPRELEALLAAWDHPEPRLAPFAHQLLATWRAADQAWAQETDA